MNVGGVQEVQGIHVLVVDDSFLFREIVKDVLMQSPGITKVETCSELDAVVPLLSASHFDVVVMDVSIKDVSCLYLVKTVRPIFPTIKIIGYTTDVGNTTASQLIDLGICCILRKTESFSLLIKEITTLKNS